jgi:TolB-like protein
MVKHGDNLGIPTIAIMPLDGALGSRASDLIAEQLAVNDIATVERAKIDNILREHGFRDNANFDQSSLAKYGKLLGVKNILLGSVATDSNPLSSYPHVFITLKVVDVESSQVTWIGHYGNSYWSSAISMQGDLQRGAEHIVEEFLKVHGKKF